MKNISRITAAVLVISSLFIFNVSVVLAAATKQDVQANITNTVYYKENVKSCQGAAGGGPLFSALFPTISDTGELVTRIHDYIANTRPQSGMKDNAQDFVTFGQKYNVNPAMLVGVAQVETQFGSDGGIGNPPKYNFWGDRSGSGWATFANYATSIEAYYKNLRTNSAYTKAWDKGDAVTIADIIYVASPPSENSTAAYIKTVDSIMHKLLDGLGGSPVTPNTVSGDSKCSSTASGTVSADGYAFPLAPQKKSVISAGYPLPCTTSSCHHDGTPAFDLAWKPLDDSTAGAAEYAISDGRVENVHIYQGIAGCYSIQLHSAKDDFWYWYGHMANPKVKDGDIVKAGQQVGEVGPRKCTANGSYPHLHIDRGCIINGVKQKGGRVECRDPGMIPLINALWATLPD